MLDQLGLDAVAESVYRGLLAHPADGAGELARRLKLTERQVRDALDRLADLALVRVPRDEPGRVQAVSPQLGMEILLARQRAELLAQQQRVEASRAAAVKLISECAAHRGGAPGGTEVHRLEGSRPLRDYLVMLNDQAGEELLTFAPGGAEGIDHLRACRSLGAQLLARRVRMRVVYKDAVRWCPTSMAHLRWLTAHGGQVRTALTLPTWMVVCDRRMAVVADDGPEAGATVVDGRGLVAALCTLFETTWRAARPLGGPERRPSGELTGQQSQVLRMLAEGCTDQTIAKRLGVSPRTARRIACDLMSLLQARSRFQAGAYAVERGYLRGLSE